MGIISAQPPIPTRLSVLGETFADLPVLWMQDEPFAPVGNWMSALGLSWGVLGESIKVKAPNGLNFSWSKNSANLTINNRTVEITPLLQKDDRFWIPLISLARVLGLMAIVNFEKQVVKLVSPLRGIEVSPIEFGWLVTITFGYPLPDFPRTGILSHPDRAYADFLGASFREVNLPIPPDTTFLTGFRVGQFKDDPPVVRFVADANSPLSISVAGRELTEDGCERWHLIIQPANNRSQWLGQILLQRNSHEEAVFLFLGQFRGELKQEGLKVIVYLPSRPFFAADCATSEDGLVQSVSLNEGKDGAVLSIALRRPANAWFKVEEDLGIALVIKLPSQASKRVRLIVVDAGHGGKDPGAVSPPKPDKPQLVEKQLTLDIAFRLKRLLGESGYEVVMTRTEDVYVPLPDRVALANGLRADAFVSIHLNSFPQPGAQWGTEVYYWTPQSYPLAASIYRNLLVLLGRKGNGIRQRQLYVVRHTLMPSVLVEPCYLNHPEEEELLRDENFREKIALAICRGIMEFFGDMRALERRGE